jgi:hypothetical protein
MRRHSQLKPTESATPNKKDCHYRKACPREGRESGIQFLLIELFAYLYCNVKTVETLGDNDKVLKNLQKPQNWDIRKQGRSLMK